MEDDIKFSFKLKNTLKNVFQFETEFNIVFIMMMYIMVMEMDGYGGMTFYVMNYWI